MGVGDGGQGKRDLNEVGNKERRGKRKNTIKRKAKGDNLEGKEGRAGKRWESNLG